MEGLSLYLIDQRTFLASIVPMLLLHQPPGHLPSLQQRWLPSYMKHFEAKGDEVTVLVGRKVDTVWWFANYSTVTPGLLAAFELSTPVPWSLFAWLN